MTCYHPQYMYNTNEKTVNGKVNWTFKTPATPLWNMRVGVDYIQVPCQKCIGCRLDYSRSWAIRCMNEASLYRDNCFITLTYDNAHLPKNGYLIKKDFQLFMKRLRKKHKNVRVVYCGEYGAKFKRPHFHAILFNLWFEDSFIFSKRNGNIYYRSEELERTWKKGYCIIGKVSFESCAYVSRYMLKKLKDKNRVIDFNTGETAESYHYRGRPAEFQHSSIKPGIGYDWIAKYYKSVYALDKVVLTDKIMSRPPRYYDKVLEKLDSALYCEVKDKRVDNMSEHLSEKLVREEAVKLIHVRKLVRQYEADVDSLDSLDVVPLEKRHYQRHCL